MVSFKGFTVVGLIYFFDRIVHCSFSNSLIIHEEKTKEITTVKEVWICDPNYHKIRRSFALIFAKNFNALRGYIKHSKEKFIRYPNTSKLVEKTRRTS